MTRLGVIAVHLGALPAGVVLAILMATAFHAADTRAEVELELHDTFIVVAHSHATLLLGVCVALGTLVVRRYGTMNWLIVASWVIFGVHLLSALLPWRPAATTPTEPGVFHALLPPHLWHGYVYVHSAFTGFLALTSGVWTSMLRTLHARTAVGT